MRILLISDFYPPHRGGVEHHVATLAAGLAKRGHSVVVATLGASGDNEVTRDGVHVRRVSAAISRLRGMHDTAERPWAPPLPDPGLSRAFRKLLAEEKPEVVHGHDWLLRSVLPVLGDIPLVSTLHYYTLSCAKKNLLRDGVACSGPAFKKCLQCSISHYGRLKGPVVLAGSAAGARWERKRTQRMISVSRACADHNGCRPDEVTVISNPVPSADKAVEVAGLPDEPFIMYAGDMRTEKGVAVLFEAHRNLRPCPPLLLMGGGDVPPGAHHSVISLGERPHAEVVTAMAAASFVVVPSIWDDPNPLVVLEALDNGTPVVAAATGGITDVVQHEHNGLLVPRGDSGALGAACQRLLDDDDLLTRLSRAARASIAIFDVDRQIGMIENVYQDVVTVAVSQ